MDHFSEAFKSFRKVTYTGALGFSLGAHLKQRVTNVPFYQNNQLLMQKAVLQD
jgi:hypothetical protein